MNVERAEHIAERARRTPGVVRLSAGRLGGVATHGAGRRVEGVRLRDDHAEVHIVVAGSVPSLPAVADAVRRSVSEIETSRRVDVFVDDVDLDVVDLDAVALDAVASSLGAGR